MAMWEKVQILKIPTKTVHTLLCRNISSRNPCRAKKKEVSQSVSGPHFLGKNTILFLLVTTFVLKQLQHSALCKIGLVSFKLMLHYATTSVHYYIIPTESITMLSSYFLYQYFEAYFAISVAHFFLATNIQKVKVGPLYLWGRYLIPSTVRRTNIYEKAERILRYM